MRMSITVRRDSDVAITLTFAYSFSDGEGDYYSRYSLPRFATCGDMVAWLKSLGKDVQPTNADGYLTRSLALHMERNNQVVKYVSRDLSTLSCPLTQILQREHKAIDLLIEQPQAFAEFTVNMRAEQLKRHVANSTIRRVAARAEVVLPSTDASTPDTDMDDVMRVRSPALLVTGRGVYQLSIRRTMLEGMDDIAAAAWGAVRNVSGSQVAALKAAYVDEVAEMRRREEAARSTAFAEGIRSLSRMKGWELRDMGGRMKLYYPGKIVATKVLKDTEYFPLTTDRFYVEGVSIDIVDSVVNNNTHARRARHPNCRQSPNDEGRTLCIGDLEGHPLAQVIAGVVDMFKLINLNSSYGNDAEDELYEHWEDYIRGGVRDDDDGVDGEGVKEWTA